MQKFTVLTGVAAPLPSPNIDTDKIIPALYLKTIKRTGLGKALFETLRYTPDGKERPEFVLNQPGFRGAKIVVAAENFGCGSSREAAVWALAAYGVRAVIAPSLGDIFHQNCGKNGVLAVILPAEIVAGLRRELHARPGATLSVDLEAQTVTAPDGAVHRFEIDPFRKQMLLSGQDDIGLTLGYEAQIAAFEASHRAAPPWLSAAP